MSRNVCKNKANEWKSNARQRTRMHRNANVLQTNAKPSKQQTPKTGSNRNQKTPNELRVFVFFSAFTDQHHRQQIRHKNQLCFVFLVFYVIIGFMDLKSCKTKIAKFYKVPGHIAILFKCFLELRIC